MTDEDDNDRMERANRIREMREGRRSRTPDDAEDASADTETSADGGPDSGTASADDDRPEPTAADDSETDADSAGSDADETIETTADADDFESESDDGAESEADAEPTSASDEQSDRSPREAAEDVLAEAGIAQTVTDADAAQAVDKLERTGGFSIPDQATTVTESDDGSTLDGAEQTVAAARAAAAAGENTYTGDKTRVLEFELGDERFCLDIDYIEEIVELENMTRVPNSPSYVEGVVDLRGQVTAIINPKDALNVSDEEQGELIIVFDSEEFEEQGHLGWVVDEVRQVTPVADEEVNESPDEDEEHINGIINRDDEDDFIVWTTPDLALNSS